MSILVFRMTCRGKTMKNHQWVPFYILIFIISVSLWIHESLYISVAIIEHSSFNAHIVPSLAREVIQVGSGIHPFNIIPSVFNRFLAFWFKFNGPLLSLSCHRPEISYFSKEPGLFLLEILCGDYNLGTTCCYC